MPMFSGPKKSAPKLIADSDNLGQTDIRKIMKGVMVVHQN
jgi:hypothetical protein